MIRTFAGVVFGTEWSYGGAVPEVVIDWLDCWYTTTNDNESDLKAFWTTFGYQIMPSHSNLTIELTMTREKRQI